MSAGLCRGGGWVWYPHLAQGQSGGSPLECWLPSVGFGLSLLLLLLHNDSYKEQLQTTQSALLPSCPCAAYPSASAADHRWSCPKTARPPWQQGPQHPCSVLHRKPSPTSRVLSDGWGGEVVRRQQPQTRKEERDAPIWANSVKQPFSNRWWRSRPAPSARALFCVHTALQMDRTAADKHASHLRLPAGNLTGALVIFAQDFSGAHSGCSASCISEANS